MEKSMVFHNRKITSYLCIIPFAERTIGEWDDKNEQCGLFTGLPVRGRYVRWQRLPLRYASKVKDSQIL